jgi:hypothetical protein
VLEGLKAAKAQCTQADRQRKADAKAALAALDDLLRANGLSIAGIKGHIDGAHRQGHIDRGTSTLGW